MEEVSQFDRDAASQLAEAMNTAQETPQPFMAAGENNRPVIVGDTTQVESSNDYTVEFEFPEAMMVGNAGEKTERGTVIVRRTIKSAYITARKARRLRNKTAILMSAFTKLNAKNEPEIMTIDDISNANMALNDSVLDAMESVVQVVLGITDEDMEYLTDESLTKNAADILVNNSGFLTN